VLRAARIAACLWEAGEIAQEAGLIPEDQSLPADGTLPAVIEFVWQKAQESDLAPASSDDLAVRTLFQSLLRNLGGSVRDSRDGTVRSPGKKEAWRLEMWGSAKEDVYAIPEDALSSLAGGALNDKAMANVLRERKLIRIYERKGENRTYWEHVKGVGAMKAVIIPAVFVEGDPEELAQAA
jgi:hypothetical protein